MQSITPAATAMPPAIFPIDIADRRDAISILMASLRSAKSKRTINAFLKTMLQMESLNLRERQLNAGGQAFGSTTKIAAVGTVAGEMNTAAIIREALKQPAFLAFLESQKLNEDYCNDPKRVSLDAFRFLPLEERIRILTGKGDSAPQPVFAGDRTAEAMALLDAARARAIKIDTSPPH